MTGSDSNEKKRPLAKKRGVAPDTMTIPGQRFKGAGSSGRKPPAAPAKLIGRKRP